MSYGRKRGQRDPYTERGGEKGSEYCYKKGYTFIREYLKLRNWKYKDFFIYELFKVW